MSEPMKFCTKGHAIYGANAHRYINGSGYENFRCKQCYLEVSALAKERERLRREGRSTKSGQVGRKYIPEFRELKRNPFEHQQRAEGIRR